MKRPSWSTGQATSAVDQAGKLAAALPVLDGGKLAATVRVEVTADRQLHIVVERAPGVVEFPGFTVWQKAAG